MKIYSDKLTTQDLFDKIRSPLSFERLDIIEHPRVRSKGWDVLLSNDNSNRHFNTGTHGAGEQGAASWDDYGRFIARLYEIDPEARIGIYNDARQFNHDTQGVYSSSDGARENLRV